MRQFKPFITVVKTGANIATGAASASIAIPTAQSGEVPRYIRISVTAAAHIKIGPTGVTAVAGDMLVMPSDAVVLTVPQGETFIAAIQDSAAGSVNIVPLEDC